MTSWLRRNAIALVALVVLAPATVGVVVASDVGTYVATRPSQPVEVAADHTTRFAGTEWRVAGVERFTEDSSQGIEADLPAGTNLVAVSVQVTPGDGDDTGQSASCMVRLGEYGATGSTEVRSWTAEGYSPLRSDFTNDIESGCNPDIDIPYLFTAYFVVPAAASQNLGLQLQVVSELPRFLLFRL